MASWGIEYFDPKSGWEYCNIFFASKEEAEKNVDDCNKNVPADAKKHGAKYRIKKMKNGKKQSA